MGDVERIEYALKLENTLALMKRVLLGTAGTVVVGIFATYFTVIKNIAINQTKIETMEADKSELIGVNKDMVNIILDMNMKITALESQYQALTATGMYKHPVAPAPMNHPDTSLLNTIDSIPVIDVMEFSIKRLNLLAMN